MRCADFVEVKRLPIRFSSSLSARPVSPTPVRQSRSFTAKPGGQRLQLAFHSRRSLSSRMMLGRKRRTVSIAIEASSWDSSRLSSEAGPFRYLYE